MRLEPTSRTVRPLGSSRLRAPAASGGAAATSLRLAALTGAIAASAVVSLAAANGERAPLAVGLEIAVTALLTLVAAAVAARFVSTGRTLPLWGLGLVAASVAAEPALRAFGVGRAVEIVLLDGLRVAALACAACGRLAGPNAMSRLLALFAALFAAGLPLGPAASPGGIRAALLAFAAAAAWGAAAAYWGGLRGRVSVADPGRGRWAAHGLIAGLVLLTLAVGGGGAAAGRAGFLSTSGGSGSDATDPFARDGVGNGERLVAGTEDIRSFAPIDDAPFLEDERPSLFDAYDDTYQAPFKPGENERSQALSREQVAESRRKDMTVAGRPSAGDFSTCRQPSPTSGRTPGEKPSPALLFVSGRVPVHLRLATYGTFDGESWRREPAPAERELHAAEIDGRTWVGPEPSAAWANLFRGADAHALKVVNLSGPALPCPPNATGVCIADVTRADLFALAAPDVIRLDRSTVPPLTVVHAASRRLDPAALDDPLLFLTLPSGCTEVPEALREPLSELAAEWTAGRSRGWDEVTAVRDRLRSDYTLDPAVGDPETGSPTLHFLREAKRGRAYQFATACCLSLRCRGYATRLVGGFYADAENYDRTLGHTVVSKEDVHVWCEVAVAPGVWATVDPSPGYDPLGPPPTWRDRAAAVFAAGAKLVVQNSAASAVCLLAVCGAGLFRRRIADAGDMLGWQLARLWRGERDAVVAAVRVLDRRCRRFGPARPPGLSPPRHFAALPGAAPFADAATRALFAPALSPGDLSLAAAAVRGSAVQVTRETASVRSGEER
ncbi:transglutaminase-like domain-containing protein [Alienimonas californiensis]|uniref:Transglutaminase-like superfamily protein n=1 Tax=Alienimonas californiensis TaxID=2527989 RepID=A0A517P6M2_9PLAN|nr:transglutaminase-like domain-containing protein [Alienimonas californiensis]QDT15026.1 Transglutaminase-like superfamily protein [Alienimonas californiensis]